MTVPMGVWASSRGEALAHYTRGEGRYGTRCGTRVLYEPLTTGDRLCVRCVNLVNAELRESRRFFQVSRTGLWHMTDRFKPSGLRSVCNSWAELGDLGPSGVLDFSGVTPDGAEVCPECSLHDLPDPDTETLRELWGRREWHAHQLAEVEADLDTFRQRGVDVDRWRGV